MKRIVILLLPAVLLLYAVFARETSTGKKLLETCDGYLESLEADDAATARNLLTDSLAAMVTVETLKKTLPSVPVTYAVGRRESRGLPVTVTTEEGGSRILWLEETPGGKWRVRGDSFLDGAMGSVILECISYASETVTPAVAAGAAPVDFKCPSTGLPYTMKDGRLFCPAGHLGEGLEFAGADCGILRDSLAGEIAAYLDAGHPYPSSFGEMYESSEGAFGRRGRFHCPDNGYAYYEITAEGLYCPYHDAVTPIPGGTE